MRGACRHYVALVALVTIIHTSGSEPVQSTSTCEAGPSLGPVGAEIGRSLLQQQHGRDRHARLDIQDGRVIVEEEDEAGSGPARLGGRERQVADAAVGVERPERQKAGSGLARLGGTERQVADAGVSVERPERHKGLLSMVSIGLNVSRWRQQVLSLASRTWMSVHAKGTRSGPEAMIAVLAIFVVVALVCGWFVAYCRSEPARSVRPDRRLRTGVGNRHLTLPSLPSNRGGSRGSHSNSPGGAKHDAGCSSMPVTWSRSMRTQYSGSGSSD